MSVLFLNGCTSAGKTTVARLLQAMLERPHLYLGIDDAFAMLPTKLDDDPDGFFFDVDGRGEVRLAASSTWFTGQCLTISSWT